jgi:hypothetical protein
MYKAVDAIFKNSFVASASSLLYTFSAYHLFDWYNRAALGESISFTFLPLVFLGLYHIIAGDYKKWYILTIGYSLLIYTHLLSSFLTFIAIILILIICYKPLLKEPKRIKYLLLAALITLPIVASYLLPLLEQMSSNTFYYSQHENITGQTKLGLKEIGWGMISGVLYSKTQNISGTGPLLIILIVLRLFVKEKSNYTRIADICAFTGLLLLIMISSVFPWGRLPLGFIQFPWRLYEFVVFFFSIAGTYYLFTILKTKRQYMVAGIGIIGFILIVFIVNNNSYKYWQTKAMEGAPAWFTGVPSVENEYYLGRMEYLPVKIPSYDFIHERGDSVKFRNTGTQIVNFERNERVTSLDIDISKPDRVELPLIYYKGYKAEQNGKELGVSESDYGLVEVEVNESGRIEIWYNSTQIQNSSVLISVIGVLIFVIIVVLQKRKQKNKQESLY